MLKNNIQTDIELFAKADERKKAGEKDRANFVLSRSSIALSDLISNTWKMESAASKVSHKCIYKWNLHGGKTTMLYLNLSGHDIFKTRFGTSPEKHCLTATPYRLFQGNLRNLHKRGT